MEYGDTIRFYPECLHILRTQLSNRMQEDMDEANISQGVPRNEAEVLDMLQDLYEQAVYEMRKRFDGPGGIYPEPNNAAFAAAEEFKDIMIRSGRDEERLRIGRG